MAHIDALVDKITDVALRDALRDEVNTLLHKQSFGLVFQEHKPETVELPNYLVKRGCKVRIKREVDGALWRVERLTTDGAELLALDDAGDKRREPVDALVVVREFGEAIYPGLRSIDRVERGEDRPCHAVINAENYHALETLLYAYEGKVDAIYIDPPYNSGARDWKYNNDYVDGVDQYRHSKWLAFMERRLILARRLLNPESSTLVVTIDEKEVHHLGMLLEKLFPADVRQMATVVINPLGQARKQELARVDEYAFFVFVGDARPATVSDDLLGIGAPAGSDRAAKVRWEWLLRGGTNSRREDRPNLFYPIYIDPKTASIVKVGDSLSLNAPRHDAEALEGLTVVWPLRGNGDEGNWRASPNYLRALIAAGHAKAGAYDAKNDRWSVLYLGKAQIKRIETGEVRVVGHDASGAVIVEASINTQSRVIAKTVWNRLSHRAGEHGSTLMKKFIPGRAFPFPKSLYAVEDTLRIMVADKKDALVLDFFAGSGTTAHALMRLNAEDDGRRRAILVTNNEISDAEAKRFRAHGVFPGDIEWEELGIFNHITKPRVVAAVTGETPSGDAVTGQYLDGTAYSDGFFENVEFFELTYEDPDLIELGRKFEAIAPLLWLKAGGRGARVMAREGSWTLPDAGNYGVLFETDDWRDFVDAVKARPDVSHVFIVSDSESAFQQIASELPTAVASTRLYDDYIRTFQINTRGRS